MIIIGYKILTFFWKGPFSKRGGRGLENFRPEAEIFGIFSIEVAPYLGKSQQTKGVGSSRGPSGSAQHPYKKLACALSV